MPKINSRFFPINYVRGFVATDREIEGMVTEAYMGFNLGSTEFRQLSDGSIRRHCFESRRFRLVKDYGCTDVNHGSVEMPLDFQIEPESIFTYRHYDKQCLNDLATRWDQPQSG